MKRSRVNDPIGTRQRILEAAFRAFTAFGYHATSIHDLRKAAGVTGGAFSHHFPNKEDLGLAVIRQQVARAVEAAWIAPVREASSAKEGVRLALSQIARDMGRDGPVTGCPLNNLVIELAAWNSGFREAMDDIFKAWEEAIAQKLQTDLAQQVL